MWGLVERAYVAFGVKQALVLKPLPVSLPDK
jgi:hypothetical protein